jgi:hypothetical protein
VAFHLGHRVSRDLDLFGPAKASFAPFEKFAETAQGDVKIVRVGEATLHMRLGSVPIDVVRYPYPLLEPTLAGPLDFPTAGLLDLATNKLAAIATRGLRRDFWDLYVILQSGVTLKKACGAYKKRFGVAWSDLYHVLRGLSYFEELEPALPSGMTPKLWAEVQRHFEEEVPKLIIPSR